jgi:hypothetical protein
MGYITAYNRYALAIDGDVAAGSDARGIFGWLDRYCASNPLDDVSGAASLLIRELRARSGAR